VDVGYDVEGELMVLTAASAQQEPWWGDVSCSPRSVVVLAKQNEGADPIIINWPYVLTSVNDVLHAMYVSGLALPHSQPQ
jgi:hypothetical protein